MLKLYPLYSGSSGNMYLVKSPISSIIVDIGVSFKALNSALEKLNINISDISALVITHEHIDHIKGLPMFLSKTNIPVYLTKGTKDYVVKKYNLKDKEYTLNEVEPEKTFTVNDFLITPFRTSHDAADPVGYNIKYDDSSLTIATDLGIVDNNVYNHLNNSNLSLIEANYDRNLLLFGKYSYPLKCRIQSDKGHLSNDDTAYTILNLAKSGKRDFILGHVSDNNNTYDEALFKVKNTLQDNGFNLDEFNINCATRYESYEVYEL